MSTGEVVSATITASQQLIADTLGLCTATVNVTGSWTGTIRFQTSLDSSNWFTAFGCDLAALDGTLVSTITSNKAIQFNIAGTKYIRVQGNTISSGSASVAIGTSLSPSVISLIQSTVAANLASSSMPSGVHVLGSDSAFGNGSTLTVDCTGMTTITLFTQSMDFLNNAIQFRYSVDGVNYLDCFGLDLGLLDGQVYNQTLTTNVGPFVFTVGGAKKFKATGVYLSGTNAVQIGGSFGASVLAGILGTVYCNVGTSALPSGASTEGSLAKLPLTQASTTSGQSGPLIQMATTTTAPTHTTAKTNPLSGDTAGNLRIIANPQYSTRSDTFTGTGNGTTINVAATPLKAFSIAVKGTGAAATTWDIRLEGSLDNSNFTQILQHTNTTGDGVTLYPGSNTSPSLYFRSRCAGLVLGSATNVVVTIVGMT